VTAVLGGTEADIEGAVGTGADGLVLAVMGGGHFPEQMLPALAAAARGMPVAAASRTGSGPVLARTYAFPGSERDLHALDVMDAGDLNPVKARVLLTMALWTARSRDEAEAIFGAYAHAGTL
jgi:L-asparaginase